MAEIEKRISEAISFVFLFFRSLWYFISPTRIVKKIKGETEVFPPLAFLAVLSFFGLKLWTYLILAININHDNNQLIASTEATLTTPEKLSLNHFISLPSLEEIFTLTIPYIFLVIILSKIVQNLFKKTELVSETDLRDIIIYFCGFLVILFPVIFLLNELIWFIGDVGNLEILLVICIPPYLYFMFRSSIPDSYGKWKRFKASVVLSVFIPLSTLSCVFGSIYLSTHVKLCTSPTAYFKPG